MIKPILRAILGVVLPLLFAALMTRFPDFPVPQTVFVALIFWVLEKIGILGAAIVLYHEYNVVRAAYLQKSYQKKG
jgi:hypothetical protein